MLFLLPGVGAGAVDVVVGVVRVVVGGWFSISGSPTAGTEQPFKTS